MAANWWSEWTARWAAVPSSKAPASSRKTILGYEEFGYTPEQTQAEYPTLPVETIRKLLSFAHSQKLTA